MYFYDTKLRDLLSKFQPADLNFSVSRSCRLEAPAYYYAFLTPICLILFINTTLFIKCIHRMRKSLQSSVHKAKSKNLKGIIGLVFLLGITWLFGIPMLDDAKLVFQYIFAILNTLQGVAVFAFQLASNDAVRKKWSTTFRKRFTFQYWPDWGSFNLPGFERRTSNSTGFEVNTPETTQVPRTSASSGADNQSSSWPNLHESGHCNRLTAFKFR